MVGKIRRRPKSELEKLIEANIKAGMSPEEAANQAHKSLKAAADA